MYHRPGETIRDEVLEISKQIRSVWEASFKKQFLKIHPASPPGGGQNTSFENTGLSTDLIEIRISFHL